MEYIHFKKKRLNVLKYEPCEKKMLRYTILGIGIFLLLLLLLLLLRKEGAVKIDAV